MEQLYHAMVETFTTLGLFVAILGGQLGHDRFLRREAATTALRSMTPIAVLQLSVAQQSSDAERAARAKLILRSFIQDNPQWFTDRTRPTYYHRIPWIELNSHEANGHYVRIAVSKGVSNSSPDWAAYRIATTIWMTDQYRAGSTPGHVIRDLDHMVAAEIRWIREHGARYGLRVGE